MSTHKTIARLLPRGALRALVGLAAGGVLVAPAGASQAITSFNASVSTSQAGGHPDFSFDFALANPGRTGGRQGRRSSTRPRACSATRTRSPAAPRATSR